jgi:hypothetical protein
LEIAPSTGKAKSRCCDSRFDQEMSQANLLWGAPRIHGELLKLGIEIAPSTVGKYVRRHRSPPSQTWRTFLTNHMKQTAWMDFSTVPTCDPPGTVCFHRLVA